MTGGWENDQTRPGQNWSDSNPMTWLSFGHSCNAIFNQYLIELYGAGPDEVFG